MEQQLNFNAAAAAAAAAAHQADVVAIYAVLRQKSCMRRQGGVHWHVAEDGVLAVGGGKC
jgi:hypothetical protein